VTERTTARPTSPEDPFVPRRVRRAQGLEAQRARSAEARHAVRTEIRHGRRPGDGPDEDPMSPAYLRARRQAALRRDTIRRRQRKRRQRRFLTILTLLTIGLVAVDLVHGSGKTDKESAETSHRAAPVVTLSPQQPAEQVGPTTATVSVAQHGSGTFTYASGSTPIRGTGGSLVRYQVKVEGGTGIDANAFAAAVDATLSDPRGWTHANQWRFERVDSGPVDATVILATPAETNTLCEQGGLNPHGYTSCRTDNKVIINLARWMLAVPAFDGDVATYRQYVVNHEMGHQLGHGHVLCNGAGQPAPVMQQQTLGLQGCTPNAWPFVNGSYLTGTPTAGE
jgi:hypothetical protein